MVKRIRKYLCVIVLAYGFSFSTGCIEPNGFDPPLGHTDSLLQVAPGSAGAVPARWLEAVPKILSISPEGHQIVRSMREDTRKQLMILAENTARKTRHQFSPQRARYVDVLRSKIKFEIVFDQGLSPSERLLAEKTMKKFWISDHPESMRIPLHPETSRDHPLFSHLSAQGALRQVSSDGTAESPRLWPTMSRSLWIWPAEEGLFTVKMPTDTVNTVSQPSKLDSGDDSVGGFVPMINGLRPLIQSGFLRDEGIILMGDAAGWRLMQPGDGPGALAYGVMIRDYGRLLQNRSYVYIPKQTVFSGRQFFSYGGRPVVGIVLDGGLSDGSQRLDEKGDYHRIFYTFDQWDALQSHLESQAQKLHAFFLSRGYHYAYSNFHGQNVLLGLTLEPGGRPHLVLRDLFDIKDLLETNSPRPFSHLDLGLLRTGLGSLWSHAPCGSIRRSAEQETQRTDSIYLKTLAQLSFRLPEGMSWEGVKTKSDFQKILENPAYKDHFTRQMRLNRSRAD